MNTFLQLAKINRLKNKRRFNKDENFNNKFFSVLTIFSLIMAGLSYGFIVLMILENNDDLDLFFFIKKIFPMLLVIEFVLKFLFKKNQTLDIMPYLRLPISRRKIFSYVVIKEFYCAYNFILIVFLIPIVFGFLSNMYSSIIYIGLLVFAYFMSLISSFLSNILKIFYNKWSLYSICFLFSFCACLLLLIFKTTVFDRFFVNLFEGYNIINILIAFVLMFVIWIMNFYVYNKFLYFQLENVSENKEKNVSNIDFFSEKSEFGFMLNFQVKQLFRSYMGKRILYAQALFLVIVIGGNFLNFGKNTNTMSSIMMFYISSFPFYYFCGMGFSQESTYFDGIMTNNISLKKLIYSKIIVAFLFSFLAFVITSTFFYFTDNVKFIYKEIAYLLVCNGPFCVLLLSSFTRMKNRVPTVKPTFVDRNAVKPNQMYFWIMFGLYFVISLLSVFFKGDIKLFYIIVMCISLPFIFSMKFWVNRAVKDFMRNRYECLKGYRG